MFSSVIVMSVCLGGTLRYLLSTLNNECFHDDIESLQGDVGRDGCGDATDCRSRGLGSNPPTAVSKLRQFRSPHFACFVWKIH